MSVGECQKCGLGIITTLGTICGRCKAVVGEPSAVMLGAENTKLLSEILEVHKRIEEKMK